MVWLRVNAEGAVRGTPDGRMGTGVPRAGFRWSSSHPSERWTLGCGGEMEIPFPAPGNSPPVWLPRNQILREASRACSSIWARGVKNVAAIKNPINFQPLVRAAGLSAEGGVLSVVNLSPLCTALICRSDGCFPSR